MLKLEFWGRDLAIYLGDFFQDRGTELSRMSITANMEWM